MFGKIRAFSRLSPVQRLVLAESILFLAIAAAAIRLLPFHTVARSASGRGRRAATEMDRRRIVELGRIIETVARHLPFRAKCFESGLAAQWMLRRRGLASTLFYGVAMDPQKALSAHVWVRAGDIDVVGCGNADDFTAVAHFPADQRSTPSSSINRPPRIR